MKDANSLWSSEKGGGALSQGCSSGASLLYDKVRERETLHDKHKPENGLGFDISFPRKLINQFTLQH